MLDALVFKLVLLVVLESNSTTSPGSDRLRLGSRLESGFREDHCSEGPGPGSESGSENSSELGQRSDRADFSATRRGKFRGGCWDNLALYSID